MLSNISALKPQQKRSLRFSPYFLLFSIILSAFNPAFGQNGFLEIATFDYNNAPFKISDQLIRLNTGGGFRTYYDFENSGEEAITGVHMWLLLYFHDEAKPVLYEYKSTISIPPNSVRNFFWDEPANGFGTPTGGVIIPYYINMSGDQTWSLREQYTKEGRNIASLLQGSDPPRRVANANAELIPEAHSDRRTMEAMYITDAPRIDGKLDDAAWQQFEFQGDFLAREPFGVPASEKTEVAIMYDDDYLYIGARCFDSEPDKIRATEMRRDGTLSKDDYFDLFFDTFHDSRNAFSFTTNPLGLRLDGTITEDGKFNREWDGVWKCKTSIDEKGWYVEIAIPWQTLRFSEDEEQVWGLTIVRSIKRKNEDTYWRLIPLYAGRLGQFRISEAGELTGLRNLKQGGNLEIKPFITGGVQRDDFVENELGDFGVDFKKSLTSTLTADFTYNTDFAQVEADREQVNLTRFSLSFPEKREFFLEGAETFRFGHMQLFYSRRIGISGGNFVPILAGARLQGKIGKKTTLGVMSIQTEKTQFDGQSSAIPQTNFSVIRLKQDVFSRSTIGAIILNKQEIDGSYNRSFGIDTDFKLSQNFSLFVVGAGTFSPDEEGKPSGKRNNFAGTAGFNWQSDLWQYSAAFLDIEDSFNPEMGFIRRTGFKRTNGKITYSPRPEQWASIRKLNYTLNGNYQTDMRNRVLNKGGGGIFAINFNNTSSFRFNVNRDFEFLDFNWAIRDGFMIPLGDYTTMRYSVNYNSGSTRNIGGSIGLNYGGFWTGASAGGSINGNLAAYNKLLMTVNYRYSRIDLPSRVVDESVFPGGKFHTNTFTTRVTYSFNPDFFVKAYLQWFSDKLNPRFDGNDRVSGNFLLRYTYSPASDFYLVLNQQTLVGTGNTVMQNRTVLAKLTYFFRK